MSLFTIKPELKRLDLKNPLHFLAVGFGSGLSPKAPGTMGTLAAIPLYLLVSGLPTHWFIALLAVGFVVGIRICQSATDAIGMADHGAIVWDEVIGFGVTMIAAPAGWEWVLAGFALFRLFDVLKPWPISWFDRRIHGGFGIMLDDSDRRPVRPVLYAITGVLARLNATFLGMTVLASPDLSLLNFHSSAYAVVYHPFHINIHYSFGARDRFGNSDKCCLLRCC